MTQFVAPTPGAEVNGQTVLSIVNGMGAFRALGISILEKYGIKDLKPDNWYKQQSWLDAFKEIAGRVGGLTLNKIGTAIPQNAKIPPGLNTVNNALAAIDVAYHMNHRNGEIGHYRYTEISSSTGIMVCENPYPCEFDKGLIHAFARLGNPQAKVTHDDTKACRKKNGESCTYSISW
jgi:hypothetical protein